MRVIEHVDDINHTVSLCKEVLSKESVVTVTIEHINLLIQQLEFNYLLVHKLNVPRFRFTVPQFVSPCFVGGYSPSMSAWDACMIADFLNRICGTHKASYYHWDAGCPHYIMDGLESPAGWEDCDDT